ncbi:MAG: hypothetical protein KAJ32_08330 [Gammaproteobacteria bacterium]|nr:hypothetical protein [Gammaproteobacteria bacterium]
MKTFFLLITLTQNGVGDINASFVNTETLEQCQQKSLMVDNVFSASKIPVIESRCIKSNLQFSEFGHASNSSRIRNFYLVYFRADTVQISAVSDWQTCMDKQREGEKLEKVYCSSSVQSIQ